MFVAVAVLGASRDAAADERTPRVELAWSAPRECPAGAEVTRRIEAQLPDASRGTLRVTARVRRDGQRYRLALAIEGRGERDLAADACDALASTAAVVVAMSGREDTAEEATTAPAEPTPSTAPTTPAPPTSTVAPPLTPSARDAAPEATSAPRTRVLLRAEAVVDGGLLPAAAPGGGVAVGAVRGALRVELAGAFYGGQSTAASAAGKGASFTLASAALRGCFAFGRSVEVAPCVGAALARIGGHGEGVQQGAVGASTLGGPEAAVTFGVPLTSALALRAGVAAFLPVTRQAFVITGLGTVHTPAAVAVNGFVGPEVHF